MNHPNFEEIDLKLEIDKSNKSEWSKNFVETTGKLVDEFETNTMEKIKIKMIYKKFIFYKCVFSIYLK